jgi:hypothetical protein
VYKKFREDEHFSYYSQERNMALDIKGYNQFIRLSRISSKNKVEINDTLSAKILEDKLIISYKTNSLKTEISLKEIIQKSIEKERNMNDNKELVVDVNNYKLIVYTIDGQKKSDDKLKIKNFEAILLLK